MFLKETGELVGTCGFHCWERPPGHSKAEIGFDVSSSHWRKGYMLEAVQPIIQFGFEQMKLDYIEATTEPDNLPSQQLLKKLGFIQSAELVDQLVYFALYREGNPN
ncbi:GNAT family N-acetyltransferase [Neobacillus sp. SCS-31]|uniref:GNAT family N-acetyltransferase n=1 Tax=Neobacillus oceani TaxID=3115292 RepID=UPI003905F652